MAQVHPGSWSIFGQRLPDFGITEKIQSLINPKAPTTAQGGSNLFGSTQKAAAPSQPYSSPTNSTPYGPTNPGSGSTYTPSTSGQAAAPTGGGSNQSSGGGFGDALSQLFNQSRSSLEGIIPTYESDFNNYQNQVNNSITQAQGVRDQQTQDTTQRYGQALKQLLQNSADLRGRTQSTFSGLGSLDSSAYGDALLKQQQSDSDNTANLSAQQNKDVSNINNTFDSYKNDQLGQINSYRNEIDRAKQGVQQAIADNDIQHAQDLANYATNLQNTVNGFATNLAAAQAQGTDVIGNLKKINGSDFLNQFGQLLAGQYNNGLSRYQIPGTSPVGQGYVGSGSGLTDQQKKLLGLG